MSGALAGLFIGAGVGFTVLLIAIPFDTARRLGALVGLRLDYWGVFWLLTVIGSAVGLVVGLVVGAIRERRARSQRERLQTAGRIGAQFSPSAEADLGASLRRDFPDLSVHLRNVLRKDLGGLRIALAEASITQIATFDSDHSPQSSTQTAAYYEAPGATFPRFRLRPTGLTLRMARAMGLQGLRFPDQPEFTRQYFVLTTEPLGAQALLDPQARAWLLAHPGLHVESGGSGVLVYRGGQLLGPGELEAFAREAADLLRLLEQGRRKMEKSPAKPSAVDELRAFAAQMPPSVKGSMERELRARLVTREHVDAFLRQSPPRKIPANIAYAYNTPRGLAAMGALFVGMTGWIAYMFGRQGDLFGRQGDWGAVAFGALFSLIGAPMLFFGGRSWWRQRRLLRRGELAAAKIVSVDSAGWIDNAKGGAFNMGARYESGGQVRQGRCTVWGKAGRRAESLAAEGKMATILYDPAHPERIVLVDALVNPPGD